MTFVDIFGGGVVNPSDQAYADYSISANLTLVWPLENADSSNVATQEIDIDATVGGLSVTLPDATLVSVGSNIYLKNVGANAFNLLKSDSTLISSIATTATYIVQLTDNSTAAGVWSATAVGTNSPAVASALAGPGLTPYGVNQLATAHPSQDINSTPYTVLATDRASLLNWVGGAGTFNLPVAATAGDNFFILVRNSGTGILTVAASDDIDDNSSKTFAVGESAFIVCDGLTYYTVGYGQTDLNVNSYLSISVAGSGVYILSAAEYAYNIINLTGVLSGDRSIEFPTSVDIWSVTNSTTGDYDLTLLVSGSMTSVLLPQGQTFTVSSDGAILQVTVSTTPQLVDEAGQLGWFMRASAPTGWIVADGSTIGSASSGATHASSTFRALFSAIWGCTSNDYYPILDSAGSPTTRGASANADFRANKRLPMPDLRGRTIAGLDNAGGTAANRAQFSTTITTSNASSAATVASATGIVVGMSVDTANVPIGTTITAVSGLNVTLSTGVGVTAGSNIAARFSYIADAQSTGAAGGEMNHTQILDELAAHTHQPPNPPSSFLTISGVSFQLSAGTGAGAGSPSSSSGAGRPMNNMQPTIVMLPCLRL